MIDFNAFFLIVDTFKVDLNIYIHTHIITIRNTAGSAEQCRYDYVRTTDHINCIAGVTRFPRFSHSPNVIPGSALSTCLIGSFNSHNILVCTVILSIYS